MFDQITMHKRNKSCKNWKRKELVFVVLVSRITVGIFLGMPEQDLDPSNVIPTN